MPGNGVVLLLRLFVTSHGDTYPGSGLTMYVILPRTSSASKCIIHDNHYTAR